MAELLLGCGSRRDKLLAVDGEQNWKNLTTLDMNPDHKPDVVWDINYKPLPFDDETWDEIHAYEVLEHLGQGQGDWRSWFAEWTEWYRLLKPGGIFFGTSPSLGSRWLWGDPSHRRTVQKETFVFLHQPSYTAQVGITPMSDFRFCFKGDFDIIMSQDNGQSYAYGLQAVKPSRIST